MLLNFTLLESSCSQIFWLFFKYPIIFLSFNNFDLCIRKFNRDFSSNFIRFCWIIELNSFFLSSLRFISSSWPKPVRLIFNDIGMGSNRPFPVIYAIILLFHLKILIELLPSFPILIPGLYPIFDNNEKPLLSVLMVLLRAFSLSSFSTSHRGFILWKYKFTLSF